MKTVHFAPSLPRTLLLVIALGALHPATTQGQTVPGDKLAPVLQARSRQIAGRSRVIVQFRGSPDTRVITGSGGLAGRQLESAGSQVAEVDNHALAGIAGNPQVAWVGVDHPAFPTLERTGAAIAATLARQVFNLTGKGIRCGGD